MPIDPSVYIILSLDTNLEVTYSVTHLFDYEGNIARSREAHGTHERVPLDELDVCMRWGADQLNDFFTDLFVGHASGE
jgi:hypothetical protein